MPPFHVAILLFVASSLCVYVCKYFWISDVAVTEQVDNAAKFVTNLPVYYINLDRSVDRRKYMETFVLGDVPSVTRISAVDGIHSKIGEQWLAPQYNRTFGDVLRQGKVSTMPLFLSHYLAAKAAYATGSRAVIVLEDDVLTDIIPYWTYSVDEIVDYLFNVDPEWEYLMLHCIADTANNNKLYNRWLEEKEPF